MFERMVKSTKRCLKMAVGRAKLTYDELLTVVTEVEMILNSRPLSYVSTEDTEEPLTPSHLMIGRRLLSLPDNPCDDVDSNHDTGSSAVRLTNRMKHLNLVLNHFWKRWSSEYLLELRESHRYSKGVDHAETVSVGDVVLVHSEKSPRGYWKLGRVEHPIKGADDHV